MRSPDECVELDTRSQTEFERQGSAVPKSILRWLLMLLVAIAVMDSSCLLGQTPKHRSENSSTEVDDSGSEDLLAAMKSLDKTLNKQEELVKRKKMRDRLVGLSVVGGALLGLLGVLFVYLRMDHATRGFHSGRLQMLAGLISFAILAVGYILWTQVLFK